MGVRDDKIIIVGMYNGNWIKKKLYKFFFLVFLNIIFDVFF